MTPKQIKDYKIIVEKGEGGCWHKIPTYGLSCSKCHQPPFNDNPDFSKWENFGRLLKVGAKGIENTHPILPSPVLIKIILENYYKDIDQIPFLVAHEVAEILRRKE